ncbi:hypothetical protein GGD64_008386, partial [Bradyrhizobium sp. CIR3A]|nr:hypothetical protein [Bradyrhizobium sp. CIR3A]
MPISPGGWNETPRSVRDLISGTARCDYARGSSRDGYIVACSALLALRPRRIVRFAASSLTGLMLHNAKSLGHYFNEPLRALAGQCTEHAGTTGRWTAKKTPIWTAQQLGLEQSAGLKCLRDRPGV